MLILTNKYHSTRKLSLSVDFKMLLVLMRRSISVLCGLAPRIREKMVSIVLNDSDLERCLIKETIDIIHKAIHFVKFSDFFVLKYNFNKSKSI